MLKDWLAQYLKDYKIFPIVQISILQLYARSLTPQEVHYDVVSWITYNLCKRPLEEKGKYS